MDCCLFHFTKDSPSNISQVRTRPTTNNLCHWLENHKRYYLRNSDKGECSCCSSSLDGLFVLLYHVNNSQYYYTTTIYIKTANITIFIYIFYIKEATSRYSLQPELCRGHGHTPPPSPYFCSSFKACLFWHNGL